MVIEIIGYDKWKDGCEDQACNQRTLKMLQQSLKNHSDRDLERLECQIQAVSAMFTRILGKTLTPLGIITKAICATFWQDF